MTYRIGIPPGVLRARGLSVPRPDADDPEPLRTPAHVRRKKRERTYSESEEAASHIGVRRAKPFVPR